MTTHRGLLLTVVQSLHQVSKHSQRQVSWWVSVTLHGTACIHTCSSPVPSLNNGVPWRAIHSHRLP